MAQRAAGARRRRHWPREDERGSEEREAMFFSFIFYRRQGAMYIFGRPDLVEGIGAIDLEIQQ
jgi:hypothetical protein